MRRGEVGDAIPIWSEHFVPVFPAENQRRILLEHGLYDSFMAQWVSIENVHEVARRLQVAMETTIACDLQAAMRSYGTRSRKPWRAWIARLAPGWSLVVYLDGWMSDSDPLSLGGQRVFDVSCISGIEEIEELFYTHDGVCTGTIYDEEEYRIHWSDLKYDLTSVEGQLEEYLCILGRVAGRFLDHDLFSSQGLLIELSANRQPV
ncbi:hypothetical protein Aple_073040 [Acrocarpospora pleiomorpha]|uniref:Uncharacterized protein n=1 Tax=Acrocarpospora pleiomorpha TaxID=90975 RepID=A0A5M3XT51_9ACTN|nr:hypothetical protein [Acrocarpospora pleiomorpha]GES24405.1 hypothetical protein Aple_073040 [Acrocarpospora pleiomorpha]